MPIYEYRCTSCQNTFSKLQPMSSNNREVPCPRCGSTDTQRQLSTFASASTATASSSSTARASCSGFT